MKNIYVLHGCCGQEEFEDAARPSGSNCHWLPWLQKQLLIKGYNCQTPEMPKAYAPSYTAWKRIMDTFPMDEGTTLVGHSCGGGFFVRYLTEKKQKIKNLVLVAPTLDPLQKFGNFLSFSLEKPLVNYVEDIHIFYAQNEPVKGIKESVELLHNTYKAHRHTLKNHGHFTLKHMGTDAFPELLKVIENSYR